MKRTVVISLIVIFILALWYLSGYYIFKTFPEGSRGEIGDMFGAINALFAGVTLIGVVTAILLQQKELKLQRKELKETREVFRRQQFENTFFNLVSQQNEILKGINYEIPEDFKSYYNYRDKLEGRDFFEFLEVNIRTVYKVVKGYLNNNQNTYTGRSKTIEHAIYNRYTIDYYILTYLKNDKNDEIDIVKVCELIIFEEYRHIYVHYFRHLYRILGFVKKEEEEEYKIMGDKITEEEKKDIKYRYRSYTKYIQAQMSFPELFIMFYNSLRFEKMVTLMNYFDFLENLSVELLLKSEHKDYYTFEFKTQQQYF